MTPDRSGTPYPRYITEENRNEEITNGALVQLYYSPRRYVLRLLEKFKRLEGGGAPPNITAVPSGGFTSEDERLSTLKEVLEHSADPAFVVEFDAQGGLKWLMGALQTGKEFAAGSNTEEAAIALEIFLRTMEHDIVHWTSVDKGFIDVVARNIYGRSELNALGSAEESERKLLVTSLAILEAAVINCPGKFVAEIERQISLPNMNQLLKNDRLPAVQQNVLALINAILSRTDANRKRAMAATLSSRQFKDTILQYVVNKK